MEQHSMIKVVVAEDEELIRNSIVKKIENVDSSFQVIGIADNGKVALELIHKNPPDLMITDIQMPIMGGIELIRTVHLYFPHIRIIITSGYADFEYARQAMRYNVNDYLLKPISKDDLKSALLKTKALIDNEKMEFQEHMKNMHHQDANPEEIVDMVQNFLRANFNKELSLEKIAKSFNFNPSYLSKIFIKHTGELPSKYLTSIRINEAKYLLTQYKNLSIKEVSDWVGYSDQFYFSRVFKQVTGFTPKEFQNKGNEA